jgi:hypothetical protein
MRNAQTFELPNGMVRFESWYAVERSLHASAANSKSDRQGIAKPGQNRQLRRKREQCKLRENIFAGNAADPAAPELERVTKLVSNREMDCRPQCGACCIAPSISSPIPGMLRGKPAGVLCVQLRPDCTCALFGTPARPAVCVSLRPAQEMCGNSREEALEYLTGLETATAPD